MASPSEVAYAFGTYLLDVERRLLTCDGQPVPLPPKAFDLLTLLVRERGRALSKQELMGWLWPDTVVEEANLSFQVATLRKALGGHGAAWVETVPRYGYRFSVEASATPRPEGSPPAAPGAASDLVRSRVSAGHARWVWHAALVLAAVLVAVAYLLSRNTRAPRGAVEAITRPLTAYPGEEATPSLSPDGSQVAFSWNGPQQDNPDIYVKLVGPGEPVRLTTDPARDLMPAWSPDGRRIAFVRLPSSNYSEAEVFVIPALGGGERRVVALDRPGWMPVNHMVSNLAWTPDSRWLAIGGRLRPDEAQGIWLLEVDGPGRRRLTTAPGQRFGARGDVAPAFSRDGRRLAFIREPTTPGSNSPYVMPLDFDFGPAGAPRPVVGDHKGGVLGIAWTPDDRGLLLSLRGRLQRVDLDAERLEPTGPPQPLAFGERAIALSVSRGGQLVYSAPLSDMGIARLDLDRPKAADTEPTSLAASTAAEHTPDYSPDGRELAFASTRSGTEEIWIAAADGSSPRQMTSVGGGTGTCTNPQWSPDGQTILFNSRLEDSSDLYLMQRASGELRRLTRDPADEIEARWSRDGRFVYFGSDRSGRFEVWKMSADGGPAVQVTHHGGTTASESPDGRFLYYAKDVDSPSSIWRMPLAGGAETMVADGLTYALNFAVGERGLYFVAGAEPPFSIDFVDHASGRRSTLVRLGRRWWYGVALHPDERSLLYATVESSGANLMLVEGVE